MLHPPLYGVLRLAEHKKQSLGISLGDKLHSAEVKLPVMSSDAEFVGSMPNVGVMVLLTYSMSCGASNWQYIGVVLAFV